MIFSKINLITISIIFFFIAVYAEDERILALVRHGESEASKNFIVCGWLNSKLTNKGKADALLSAELLQKFGCEFDIVYTSVMSRAIDTSKIITKRMGQHYIPIVQTWKLNEKHYGNFTGLNKAQVTALKDNEKMGDWRRSYNIFPPKIETTNTFYDLIMTNKKLVAAEEDLEEDEKFPTTESFEATIKRVISYWDDIIVPNIKNGKRIMIVAHSNVLRAFIKHLENLTENEMFNVNVPSGIPFIYKLDDKMKAIEPRQFLGDQERVKKGIEDAASIGSS